MLWIETSSASLFGILENNQSLYLYNKIYFNKNLPVSNYYRSPENSLFISFCYTLWKLFDHFDKDWILNVHKIRFIIIFIDIVPS